MSDAAAATRLLQERAASIPERIRALGDGSGIDLHPGGFRAVRTTGVGSSGAHARALAHWLANLGVDARYLAPSAFPDEHAVRHDADLLIGFSQGLSPNARLALSRPDRWRQVLAVTSTRPADDDTRAAFASELERAGVCLIDSGAPDEFGTLVRLVGPSTGFWVAWKIARAFGAAPGPDAETVASTLAAAAARARRDATAHAALLARHPVLFVTSAAHLEAADNVRLKWVEGLLGDVPPVADLLDFAHGPFQAIHDRDAVVVSLALAADRTARERLARLDALLSPARHRRIALDASLDHPLAALEFEAGANELLLAAIGTRHDDPSAWPGRDADAALYEVGANSEVQPSRARGRALETATWPEIEIALGAGQRTAILPLGSTEQHGPGLPFATDSWIADALADRLAAALPDSVRLPTLGIGAASEHLDFAGTLSLREETLTSVLADLARSLAGHGFREIFCFSAHGGNLGTLRHGEERLRAAAAPARWIAFTDHARLNAALFEIARSDGISPEAAGQHAGEIEASILDAVRPGALRRARLEKGLVQSPSAGDSLFYPSLRANSESGVVGDPSAASRERGFRYLSTWCDVLVRAIREARNSRSATGTLKA